jgi:chitodextrinase
VPHRITGSRVLDPSGRPQNYFSVEGPDIATMRTDLFQVAGQIARPAVPDTQAPTAPTGLTATAAANGTVALSWSAATDDRAVVGYEVHRDGAAAPVLTTTSTSATDAGLAAGSTHTYTVSAVDAAHNVSPPSGAASVTVPVPPPAPVPPGAPGAVTAALPATVLGTASVPVQLGWGASTSDSGVARYDVAVTSADGGSAVTTTATGTAATVALTPGHRYVASVRARSTAGVAGAATTAGFALALPQENDRALSYSKGWSRKKVSGSSGGFTESTSSGAAVATFRFSGSAFAWAATLGAGGGQAVVRVDGVAQPAPVDLHATTASPRRLVLARSDLDPTVPHAVTVTLPAATGKGKAATSVDVDAFATLAP